MFFNEVAGLFRTPFLLNTSGDCFCTCVLLQKSSSEMFDRSEAVTSGVDTSGGRCYVKKVFLEISQNSQETPAPDPLFQ